MSRIVMVSVSLCAIPLALTLPYLWMSVLQAAVGGLIVGFEMNRAYG